jgi:hypothetical protein
MSAKTTAIIVAILVVLILLAGLLLNASKQMTGEVIPPASETGDAKAAVQDAVIEFGNHLKNVPLTASPDMLFSIIRSEYGGYVTPELLNSWLADPTKAPGRLTSSPWPERIEVRSIEEHTDTYIVRGTVILMTSQEVSGGGNAGTEPITLTLSLSNGVWLISGYEKEK